MAKVRLIARLVPKPGNEAKLLEVAKKMLVPTHAEPGNEMYELFAANEGGRLLFNELWKDQAAMDEHMQSPHMQEFAKAIEPLLAEPLELNFLTQIGQ